VKKGSQVSPEITSACVLGRNGCCWNASLEAVGQLLPGVSFSFNGLCWLYVHVHLLSGHFRRFVLKKKDKLQKTGIFLFWGRKDVSNFWTVCVS
jgi:hypothetical protein